MSTDTDGAPPSVSSPGPEVDAAGAAGEGGGRRRADGSLRGPSWLQEEIARRAAEAARTGRRSRHARADDDEEPSVPPPVVSGPPRHGSPPAMLGGPSLPPGSPPARRGVSGARLGMPPPPALRLATPAPARPPAALRPPPPGRPPAEGRLGRGGAGAPQRTPVRSADLVPPTAPLVAVPPADVAVPEQRRTDSADAGPAVERVRVVLSERRRSAAPVRTVEVVQEGTGVGQLLRSSLIRSQLTVALWFAAAAGVTLGALPLVFALFPAIGRVEVLGVRLPWLLLGVLVYPFLLGLGWWHTRAAERVEQSFADHVQD